MGIFPPTACFQNNLLLKTEIRQERDNLKRFLPAGHFHWHAGLPTDLPMFPAAPKPLWESRSWVPRDEGTYPHLWSSETPGTQSNSVPCMFGLMTLLCVPPSAEAMEIVPSGSQLPAPPVRLDHSPVPITPPAVTSPCPPFAHLLSSFWHARFISTSLPTPPSTHLSLCPISSKQLSIQAPAFCPSFY